MPSAKDIGDDLVNKDFEKVELDSLIGAGKRIGIYFSAHWCPPCRNFTPKLVSYYEEMKAKYGDNFQIVFVSLDRDEKSFKEYFATMPWLAVAYDADRSEIAEKFSVSGIPSFWILDENGEAITKDGRKEVDTKKDIMLVS